MLGLWHIAAIAVLAADSRDTLDLPGRTLGAQSGTCGFRWFQERRYFEPLAAEPRAAQLNALALTRGKAVEFLQEDNATRSYWDIDVGAEMPVLNHGCASEQNGRVAKGGFGIGYWISVDFHMLEDLDDPSAPIINTDYRFAFANLKAQYGVSELSQVGLRVQMGHESTHLGDEYSLAAVQDPAFRRINVSYEWLDAALSLEQNDGYTSFRGGVVMTFPFGDPYFGTDTINGSIVQETSNWWEPYVGFQKRMEVTLLGKAREVYVSTDVRWKTIYDYDRTATSGPEDRQWSVNLLIGATGELRSRDPGLGRVSPYFRFYSGVNPHGQFRNQRSFRIFGLGLRMHR